ncbi:PepSY domain-containing protein [Emcibacter sp. SYSU 3D8]|uniref:PepSY-associated TM helix domain-containing protein n=1 Tax=Emcibacter sp. SYSU 3D8 TaxID=3133969 RepID=UPI0031FEEB35
MSGRTTGNAGAAYRAIWRWHFYAGLFCVPFVIVLALTGSTYLFKPQVEAWLERSYDGIGGTGASASAAAQVGAALAAVPGSSLRSYEVRADAADAARVTVAGPDGDVRVFVHPRSAAVLGMVPEDERLMQVVKTIHGELLIGDSGAILVELAASWAIVMIVTGLYLWWPRKAAGLAGVLYPRLKQGGRQFWRDLHAVIGIWVSAFALCLLLSGLPWTNVWGGAFKDIKQATGMTGGKQDWKAGMAAHVHHDHAPGGHGAHPAGVPDSFDAMVAAVRPLRLPPPVLIQPPSDRWPKSPDWVARSDTQNRPQRVMLVLDPATGAVVRREGFGDSHLVDRIVGYGIAAHEGQLFGPLNQALGVLTALSLIGLSVTGYVMWWQRRPDGRLGAPPAPDGRIGVGLAVLILALAVFLPVLGASLIAIALFEWLVLRRVRPVSIWLGLRTA